MVKTRSQSKSELEEFIPHSDLAQEWELDHEQEQGLDQGLDQDRAVDLKWA
jgi:hypothetical protein